MPKQKRNIIYFLLYLFFITFLLIEIILRFFDPFGASYLYAIDEYNKTFKRDPDYFYINHPGFSGDINGVEIKINSQGLRSPLFEADVKTKKRLLILGDSIVFGWGVKQDSIFIYRLYNLFKDSLEIIGAGTNSWNTRAEYAFLKKDALAFQPDYLVLIINPNDVYLKIQSQPKENHAIKNFLRKTAESAADYSYTCATFLALYEKQRYARIMNEMFEDSLALSDAQEAMTGIIELCQQNNIELVNYIYGDPGRDVVKKCSTFYAHILNKSGLSADYFDNPQLFSGAYTNSIIDGPSQ